MGGGRFDDSAYHSQAVTRSSQGIDDFAYSNSATRVHETLDPQRIKNKVFHLLESRDSVEHPISTPVIVCFDVTGSNASNAKVVQSLLPQLLGKLQEVVENPQVAIWANDDFKAYGAGGGRDCLQMGEFESDNRIDEGIRNIWITNNGGGNGGESYDLALYGAARKTITDSMEKRNKRGLMFIYADEPFRTSVLRNEVSDVFGDVIEADIPIEAMIAEVTQKWDVRVIWPSSGYMGARGQYISLFGQDKVIILEAPNAICDQVQDVLSKSELAEGQSPTAVSMAGDSDYENNRVE